jgi:large subunit ribosomal protein L25
VITILDFGFSIRRPFNRKSEIKNPKSIEGRYVTMRMALQASSRSPLSKGGIKRLRLAGYVPVTVSARGGETTEWSVPARELTDILRHGGQSALIELRDIGAGDKTLVMPRDIQRDPISGRLLHVGFAAISAREPVTAEVRVALVGEPVGVRTGTAVLEHETSTVLVRALPDKLPTHINLDVSSMDVGDVLHVSDIVPSQDYQILTPPDTVTAVVHIVRAAVAEKEEMEAEEIAEPEEEQEKKSS